MANNVKKEFELYEPMRLWLQTYLEDKYKGWNITTVDSHARTLSEFLEELGVGEYYPQTVGLDIQIDVLGVMQNADETNIVFIEAKKDALTLHDLGQLWAYCKLCDPLEAFLLSSQGLGSLSKILINLSRVDLLEFGKGKMIKEMRVGKWDVSRNSVDFNTLVPKKQIVVDKVNLSEQAIEIGKELQKHPRLSHASPQASCRDIRLAAFSRSSIVIKDDKYEVSESRTEKFTFRYGRATSIALCANAKGE